MAIHESTASLLRESLREYVEVAEHCVGYRKSVADWGAEQAGGCLGLPGAAVMFMVADTIGSFHRGKDDFVVVVDGESLGIKKTNDHFRILNSEYYGLDLSSVELEELYKNYRSLLVHNASLAPKRFLLLEDEADAAFPKRNGELSVNVAGFLRLTRSAVDRFLSMVDEIVPQSRQDRDMGKRA